MENKEKVKKPLYKKWWFWVIIAIIVIAIGSSAGGDGEKDHPANSSDPAAAETTGIAYESVDLQSMLNELSDNAMKAEKTYQDKHVEITGKITNFDSDGGYISIEPIGADEWNFETVMCYIKTEEQEEFLMGKSKGDTVVIKGKIISVGEIMGYSVNIDEIG